MQDDNDQVSKQDQHQRPQQHDQAYETPRWPVLCVHTAATCPRPALVSAPVQGGSEVEPVAEPG